MLELAAHILAAFAVSMALVPLCRLAARRFGYTAAPRDDRWHRRPTALLGGVGIALTVLVLHLTLQGPATIPLLAGGAALIFLLGLVDDLVSLAPYTKLAGEIGVASLFVFFGYRLGWSDSLTVDTLLTVFWIVGITNALNLLDNMDGLCAGIALIAGATLLGTFVLDGGLTHEAKYLALLLGAMAGFLVYNFHPASIFMGDGGSLFIGLNLGVLALRSPYEGYASGDVLSILAAPLLVLLVPIFDTALVSVSRIVSGRSVAQGGRDHSSHRLVAMGLSERRAVAVLWAMGALGGLLAFSMRAADDGWAGAVTAVFAVAMILFAVHLSQIRVYDNEADGALLRTGRVTPFVIRFVYRRRIAEVLLDVCLVSVAYYMAYYLRFGGPGFSGYFPVFLQSLPLVVGIQILALLFVGAYQGVWRYYSLMDGVTFAKGVALGTIAVVAGAVYIYQFHEFSRSVFVIYAALLLLLLIGSRASFRLMNEFAHRRRHRGERLLIYGARHGAAIAVRELAGPAGSSYRLLGFIDDDPNLTRTRVHGYTVFGGFGALESLVSNGAVDAVVIAVPLIDVDRLRALQALCKDHGVSLARLSVELSAIEAAS